LVVERLIPMERGHVHAGLVCDRCERGCYSADLAGAGEEDEEVVGEAAGRGQGGLAFAPRQSLRARTPWPRPAAASGEFSSHCGDDAIREVATVSGVVVGEVDRVGAAF